MNHNAKTWWHASRAESGRADYPMCEISSLIHKRARSKRFFAMSRHPRVQNGPKFRENSIGQQGIRLSTRSTRNLLSGFAAKNRGVLRSRSRNEFEAAAAR